MIAMNDYREKQMEHAKYHFANHKAEIKEHDGITVLNWRNQNGSSDYYVHYVFDGKFLYISGDLGSAVVHLTEKATLKALSRYINMVDYFVEKIKCSTNKYAYDEKNAIAELRERLFPDDEEETPELVNADLIEEIMQHYSHYDGFRNIPTDLLEQVEELDESYFEWIYSCGEEIHGRIILWLVGLQMAWEQVNNPDFVVKKT